MQNNENIQNKRSSIIYGNCQVLSPDGILMFRCLEKRAKWYLKRNLAKTINDNPLIVQLTFQPKGPGVKEENLKSERHNRCVACGEEDLNELTKHHIVPYEYRKNFPDERKQHNSLFVVPICKKCHTQYEQHYATPLKKKIAKEYGVKKSVSQDVFFIRGAINTLLKHYDSSIHIPSKKQLKLKEKAFVLLIEKGMIEKIEQLDDLAYLKVTLDNIYEECDKYVDNHGKFIVECWKDRLNEFEIMWVNHFITSMNPKYTPEYLIEYIKTENLSP